MEKIKICSFCVKKDEEVVLKETAEEKQIDLKLVWAEPTLENAFEVEGCLGVTISGLSYISDKMLDAYYEYGVRFLSTRTRGYNHIDIEHAKKIGIRVSYATYPPDSVAEFTVMLMLMCLRNYKQQLWRGQVNDFDLIGLKGRNLSRMTVGILGTGQIGFRVIQYLSGFGCKILAYDPFPNEKVKPYVEYVDKHTLYQKADIISLHLPLFEETRHMVNQESLHEMKDGVILINCARGELADTEALIQGIESGKIGALGLDTVEGEAGIVHGDHRIDILAQRNLFYLRQFRNVIMTPHMAFYTNESVVNMARCGIETICKMASGEACREEV